MISLSSDCFEQHTGDTEHVMWKHLGPSTHIHAHMLCRLTHGSKEIRLVTGACFSKEATKKCKDSPLNGKPFILYHMSDKGLPST